MNTVVRTYKYRIYPTVEQARTIEAHLAICCELYNAALQERRDAWRVARKSINFYQQSKQLTEVRRDRPDVAAVYGHVGACVLRRVDRAFAAFFRRLKAGQSPGYPRFRSPSRFDSLTYRKEGHRLSGHRLHVTRFGEIKIKLSRPLIGEIKTLTIKREAGRWFACFSIAVDAAPLPASSDSVGVDVGLSHFASLSDGVQIENHRHARQAEASARRAQRRIARRKRGSNRRRAAVRLFQRAQARVFNRRSDFQHKLSTDLVRRFGIISVEQLNVKGMVRGRFAKSINDAAWSSFIDKLAYKAASAGRVLVKVDPRGTSQHCICGARVSKTLAERWHQCPECGYSAPRDVVSAQVIDRLGLSRYASTKELTP